jgi:hypothetical protein
MERFRKKSHAWWGLFMKPFFAYIGVAVLAAIWILAPSCSRQPENGMAKREKGVVLQQQLK